jgi:hypothetical protein
MVKHLFICAVLWFAVAPSTAQAQFDFKQSCLELYQPVTPLKDSGEVHSPKKATVMSAIIPGLGQVYNQKYWKVGVIYAAAFGIGYGIKYNSDSMRNYQNALIAELDTLPSTVNYWYPDLSVDKIRSERNYYRKNRDRLILGAGLLYALQIIDANVDAHLREFEVNKDLAIKANPGYMILQNRVRPSFGLTLTF